MPATECGPRLPVSLFFKRLRTWRVNPVVLVAQSVLVLVAREEACTAEALILASCDKRRLRVGWGSYDACGVAVLLAVAE